MEPTACKVSKGFTLIELLVVIAIIAILAAILFPVFAKAREKARQTQCLNNEKQIATSLLIYVQEHDEKFPTSDAIWSVIDVPAKVLKCPTAGKTINNAYIFSQYLSGVSLGEVFDTTSEIMIADGEGKGDQTLNPKTYDNIAYSAKNFTMRHQGKYAAAFADGHVEMRSDPAWKFATKLWMDAAKIPSSATIDNYITSAETWPNSSIDPDYASNKVVGGGGYGFMNYSSTGMNGQPGVQGGWSRAGASSYTGPVRTVVCACTLLASGGYQSLCGAKPSNTNFESAYILGTANGYLRFDVDAVTGTISCWAPQSLVDPNHVFVLAGRIGNGKIELFLNGKRVASNTYTTQIADPDPAGPAFIVGNYSASGDSTKCTNGWAGYLGDAVLFDTTIGDAELQDVTNYLKAKYAVGKEKDQ